MFPSLPSCVVYMRLFLGHLEKPLFRFYLLRSGIYSIFYSMYFQIRRTCLLKYSYHKIEKQRSLSFQAVEPYQFKKRHPIWSAASHQLFTDELELQNQCIPAYRLSYRFRGNHRGNALLTTLKFLLFTCTQYIHVKRGCIDFIFSRQCESL